MALNTRGALDPRWAFAHRGVVRGTMLCNGVLFRAVPDALGVDNWNPLAANPDLRVIVDVAEYTEIYRGPARVQPGQDWRARKQNTRDEMTVEHATRIQLDFASNTLDDGIFPDVRVNDVFRVTEVLVLGGIEVDPQLKQLIHIVRNFTPSSNAWVRNLLCDTDMNRLGVPLA